MKIEDKRITFPKSLSVKFAGKIIEETETHLTLEGEDEESYLKIFTPFRGVAKLVLYENDRWVDAETLSSIDNFDFSSLGLDNMANLSLEGEENTKGKNTKGKNTKGKNTKGKNTKGKNTKGKLKKSN